MRRNEEADVVAKNADCVLAPMMLHLLEEARSSSIEFGRVGGKMCSMNANARTMNSVKGYGYPPTHLPQLMDDGQKGAVKRAKVVDTTHGRQAVGRG